jgi:hypothetical protein
VQTAISRESPNNYVATKGHKTNDKGRGNKCFSPINHFLFLAEMFLAFAFASALDEAPQAFKDNNNLVGLPSLYSGPAMLPILAKKLARLGLSPDLTGALRFMPSALALALPLAFNPPFGFFPSDRVHAADFITYLF